MEATKRVLQEEFCGLVLTYRVNDTLLCVPVEHVESVIEPPALVELPSVPDYILGAFLHRGKTALAISLRKILRLPGTAQEKAKKESLLVVWMGNQPVGYWVDEIKGMTDSGRGHWSAVPALIRDQGITRALVCDGNVYFPLDLTQSRQFREITRAMEALEKARLHEVREQTTATPVGRENRPMAAENEPITAKADVATVLPEEAANIPQEAAQPQPEQDTYVVADYPTDTSLEQTYEDQIEADAFAEHEIAGEEYAETIADVAIQPSAEIIPIHPALPEVHFDANGQGDAFPDPTAHAVPDQPFAEPPQAEQQTEAETPSTQLDAFDEGYLATLRQEARQAQVIEVPDDVQEPVAEGLISSEPEQDEIEVADYASVLQAEIEADYVADEPVEEVRLPPEETDELQAVEPPDEVAEDVLLLEEEPYSLLPDRLPELSDADELIVEEQEGPARDMVAVEAPQSDQPETGSELIIDHSYESTDAPTTPDMKTVLARADYYADLVADDFSQGIEELKRDELTIDNELPTVIPDETGLDEEEHRPPPAIVVRKAELRRLPDSEPGLPRSLPDGVIIRPDGEVSKSFGLIKLFTIILATSAAGTWWFREELFYREQIRKEAPSILQNEIAFLYAERVKITSHENGRDRMVVDTPDEKIQVIRKRYVDDNLLRERKKKGVKIHRVRKGDTLWAIANRYLQDPYRYPELAENNRIHNPDMIRPGDVVKISFKKPDTE